MTRDLNDTNPVEPSSNLSKRGARRVIQRAFVLAGRNRTLRQSLRDVQLNTRWAIEDWDLEWTVLLNSGHPEFHRGHVGKAQVALRWQSGKAFLGQIETGLVAKDDFAFDGDPGWRRIIDALFSVFRASLKEVLHDPVDDDGVRLI